MNVLSLFDGMSCGQIALNRIGIKPTNYFASEIKPHAIEATKHNFPNTQHLGDITKIRGPHLPKIDLIIGGSPCQDFSRANSERKGVDGKKSSLFFEYVRLLKECKPSLGFLLENVVMKIPDNHLISKHLGVEPVGINSRLVSPQMRERYYWTNIPGLDNGLFGKIIGQPKDLKININDVLTSGFYPGDKVRCLLEGDSRPLATPSKMFHRFYSTGFTTLIFRAQEHFEDCKKHYDLNFYNTGVDGIDAFKGDLSVYEGTRYLNQQELEACQTVPAGYTSILDRNKAACVLGDGWTVDVISHIFKGLKA